MQARLIDEKWLKNHSPKFKSSSPSLFSFLEVLVRSGLQQLLAGFKSLHRYKVNLLKGEKKKGQRGGGATADDACADPTTLQNFSTRQEFSEATHSVTNNSTQTQHLIAILPQRNIKHGLVNHDLDLFLDE